MPVVESSAAVRDSKSGTARPQTTTTSRKMLPAKQFREPTGVQG
jgi:hypothetical protein